MTPKSCKCNKYPEPSAIKTALFLAIKLIFDTTAKKTALFVDGRLILNCAPSTKIVIFMDRKRHPTAVLSGRRELNYVKAVK